MILLLTTEAFGNKKFGIVIIFDFIDDFVWGNCYFSYNWLLFCTLKATVATSLALGEEMLLVYYSKTQISLFIKIRPVLLFLLASQIQLSIFFYMN